MPKLKMSYENFFGAKTSVTLFIRFKNCRKQCKGSHESICNWHANHMHIWVSNYGYPIIGIQLQRVEIGYL